MINIYIPKEAVVKATKTVLTVAAYGLVVASYVSDMDMSTVKGLLGKTNYSDAVDAIMSSTMFSSDKRKMLDQLKKDGDATYYKSVIKVVKSSMFSRDKIEAIEMLSEK